MKYRNNSWDCFLACLVVVFFFFPLKCFWMTAGKLLQKVLVPITREKLWVYHGKFTTFPLVLLFHF